MRYWKRLRNHVGTVGAALIVAGCASYQLEPLATTHPASPEAPAAPARPPSQTLAYKQSDIPEVRPVSPAAAALHGEHGPRATEGAGSPRVIGEGEVVALAPQANQIVVEHGEIQGFMEAMTMGYRIDPLSLLTGLQPGDKIRFTIDVQRRAIVAIEKLR
jgi:Cu/Ag efflux protein CusF